jgi:hypothetical protein
MKDVTIKTNKILTFEVSGGMLKQIKRKPTELTLRLIRGLVEDAHYEQRGLPYILPFILGT